MPSGGVLQTSFSAGEFSPRAQGRSDLRAYFQGAEILDNVFPLVEGPAFRRGGFAYVGRVKNDANKVDLIPFSRSDEKTILIEAGPGYFRFYDGDTMAPIMNGPARVEVVTPYSEAEARNLYWSQSADVMWFCQRDGGRMAYALRRLSDVSWTFQVYETENGPMLGENVDDAVTITPSGLTGAVTLTASSGVFAAGHVGALFRLFTPGRGRPYKAWQPEEQGLGVNFLREYAGRVYRVAAAGNGDGSNQPPVHEAGTLADGGGEVSYEFRHDLSGVVKITGYTSPTQVSASVLKRLPAGTVNDALPAAPTERWAEGAFSSVSGFPKIAGIFEQRLFFISTTRQPDTLFLSRTSGFSDTSADFTQYAGSGEVVDDHAIVITLADNEINTPGWAVADRQLVLGGPRGLIEISGPSPTEPLTPAGAIARRVPGSKPASFRCRGVIADGSLVYASIGGTKLIEYDQAGAFRNLIARAEHVGAREIIRIEWLGEPYNRLFILRADETLWCLTRDREQEVEAVSRVTPGGGGAVEAISKLKDAAGYERLIAVMRRTIDGATVRTIERLALDWRLGRDDAWGAMYLDAAVDINLWNTDEAKTITLSAAGDPGAGDAVTLTAAGHAPFTGREGDVVALRSGDLTAGCQVRIETVTSGSVAAGVFVIGPDDMGALLSAPLSAWAFCESVATGLGHLEGETVAALIDGADYGDFVVSGGAVDVGEPFGRAIVGLRTPWRGRSLPLSLNFQDGPSRGRRMSLDKALVTLREVGVESAQVRVIEDGRARGAAILVARGPDDNMGAAPGIDEIVQQEVTLAGRGARRVQLEVFGDGGPLPATLESIAVRYSGE